MKVSKVICLLIFCITFHTQLAAMEAMEIVYFNDAEPFCWNDDQGTTKGVFIDIMEESIGKRLGIHINHTGYPWKRAQKNVKAGLSDAFITIPTQERKKYISASSEYVYRSRTKVYRCSDTKSQGSRSRLLHAYGTGRACCRLM